MDNESNTDGGLAVDSESADYVFIVFSKSGKPKAVGQNAEEAWRQLAGETMRWQFWRNLYRTQYGYFGKRVSLT